MEYGLPWTEENTRQWQDVVDQTTGNRRNKTTTETGLCILRLRMGQRKKAAGRRCGGPSPPGEERWWNACRTSGTQRPALITSSTSGPSLKLTGPRRPFLFFTVGLNSRQQRRSGKRFQDQRGA